MKPDRSEVAARPDEKTNFFTLLLCILSILFVLFALGSGQP
jgi:hypothetical protein